MLDKIILFSIRHKLIVALLTLLLVIWGGWSVTRLPIDAVPDITNNQVQIITVCPTLAGQEVEQLVTSPIEQSIANLPDLEETRSISRFGLSVITVVFDESVNIYFARQLVHERLKEAEERIPAGIGTPELAPVSTGLGEVYQYIIHPREGSEQKYDAKDLREMQDWIVARQLNGTPGIAEVNSFGGEVKQYEVAVNPDRLRAMNVSIADLLYALEQNNQNTGGAYIDKKPNAYFIRGIGLVTSLEDVGNIAVKTPSIGIPILVKDVAEVRFGKAVRYGALTFNGEVDAVGGVVMMLKGANSREVVERIKEKIPVIQQSLPEDIVIEPYLDRTDLVGRAIGTVERNLIEGAIIVIFVLVLFLGNLRAGLIVASAIPLSMLFALGLMNVFGVSANLMSLGAIDFGLIVDGAVIIVEAILIAPLNPPERRKQLLPSGSGELTLSAWDRAVFLATSKIRNSAAFGEIIILIVYIPILTLTGVEGKMFTPMAQTVGFAILGALILSLTYIPMMSALFLSQSPVHKKNLSDRMMNRLQTLYQPLLQRAIRAKYTITGATALLFIASLFIFKNLGGEFIPQLQEGDYAFHCILPQGSSLSQSIETSMQASQLIRQFDEVKMVVGKTGAAEVPTDPMPPEATDLMIILNPQDQWTSHRSYDELADAISEALEVIPGVYFEKNQPIQMRFNELMTGIRQDVAVKIFGENLDTLALYAERVSRVIQSVEGATEPQTERVSGLPQINVEYDRTRLANYGISVSEANATLSAAFAGKIAGQVFENERQFDLVVRLDSTYRADIDNVSNLMIPAASGTQIPLSQVANIGYRSGPAQISREAGKRRIVIGFNVSGRDVQSVVNDIQEKLNEQVKLPTGYYFTYGGQFENLQKASRRLLIAVPVSLLLILVLLYITFRSWRQTVLIFTAIPMSAIGGIAALLLRGMPFSISAGVGFIALFGVSVLNGIVLIGTFNQLAKDGITDILERVREGTKTRLRPVLMTATVASFGFLPMALSTGAGAEVQKPLATVVIGGLITATFLTLFVLPLLYLIFNKVERRMKNEEHPTAKKKSSSFKKLFILHSSFFIIIGGICLSAKAQTPLTPDDAINIALKNNGTLQAKDRELKSAQTLRGAAWELPKLEIGAQLGQYSSAKFDRAFQVSQTIPFPTLFGARRKLANAEAQSKVWERDLSALELKNQVRTLFCQIGYLQQNQKQLRQLDSLYADFVRVAQLRYQTGDTKQLEIGAAETKRGEVRLQLTQNETELNAARRTLQALLNTDEPFVIADSEPFAPLSFGALADSASLAAHPAVRILQQEASIAEQTRKVERAQALPDFTIGYTNQSLIGWQTVDGQEQFVDANRRFSYANIGIAVPLTFGANRAKMRSLDYRRQASEANAEQQAKQLAAQLANALEQHRQDRQAYDYYREQALPNADALAAAAQLGYRTGETGYVEYLYALQTTTDIRLGYLRSIRQVNQSVILIYSLLNQ